MADRVTLPIGPVPAGRRDGDDDKLIHPALTSAARWLITGNPGLLALAVVHGVQILSPNRALRAL